MFPKQLARKSKTVGLNDEEKKEQAELRQEYIRDIKKGVETALDAVEIIDKVGNRTKIEKKSISSLNQKKLQ